MSQENVEIVRRALDERSTAAICDAMLSTAATQTCELDDSRRLARGERLPRARGVAQLAARTGSRRSRTSRSTSRSSSTPGTSVVVVLHAHGSRASSSGVAGRAAATRMSATFRDGKIVRMGGLSSTRAEALKAVGLEE